VAAETDPLEAAVGSNDAVPRSVVILGFRLDLGTREETRAWLREALTDPWDGRCRHIVTLNPEYVMAARSDSSFAMVIQCADLVTADGVGVVAAARLIHGERVERVTGVDLVELLAELSGECNAPLFMLGAGAGVADDAFQKLRQRHPEMQPSGTWAGGTPALEHDAPALGRISDGAARAVVVAYGAPGQVFWIERNRDQLASIGVRAAIGVGGALDYLSGAVERPPDVIRRLGLEWLLRLVREPRRWRRQIVLPLFVFRVLIETVRVRTRGQLNRR
jgi:N-acetylglucosaminyldiphosphoundecaprenol N-acetyl-beta-D-mannosaminyltransferase